MSHQIYNNQDSVNIPVDEEASNGVSPSYTDDGPAKETEVTSDAEPTDKITLFDYLQLACFVLVALLLCVPVTLLLLIFILLLRLLQLFAHGANYIKITKHKWKVISIISMNLVLVLIFMGITYPITKYIAALKHAKLNGLPLSDWVEIICMLSGFYLSKSVLNGIILAICRKIKRKKHVRSWIYGQDYEIVEALMEAISCLAFWWAELETKKRVPAFTTQEILGLRVHKWIEVPILIILVYNIIRFVIDGIVWLLWKHYKHVDPDIKENDTFIISFRNLTIFKEYMVYCAIKMRSSIIFLLTTVLIILVWGLHMGSHLKKRAQAASVFDFVYRTCISLLICSILWWIKSCILLAWEAHAVYIRLKTQIVEKGKLLYFLAILDKEIIDEHRNIYTLRDSLFREEKEKGNTIYDLYQVVKYLEDAKNILSDETFTSRNLDEICEPDYDLDEDEDDDDDDDEDEINRNEKGLKDRIFGKENTTQLNEESDWVHYTELLIKVAKPNLSKENIQHFIVANPPREIYTTNNIESWMEASRKSCLYLAKSIGCAKALTVLLNKIIIVIVVVAVFIIWLQLTGLATTQLLVLIGSPLLAATFIFGDSCKTAFQGLMFVYVLEPFSVGDLCVIDGEMMEVYSIGIGKTTFTKIGINQGQVIYPNSVLMQKVVINHKTAFDWNDSLEFDAGSLGKGKIEKLKQDIKTYVDEQNKNEKKISHNVWVLAKGESVKVIVDCNYLVRNSNWTFFDCHRQKNQLRSDFAVHIKNLVEGLKEQEKITTSKSTGSADQDSDSKK